MEARMTNPAQLLPDAMAGISNLYRAMHSSGIDQRTLELVHLRVSQINACSACVFAGVTSARKGGETDDRLHQLAAWRESDLFSDAERAALALAEAATRLADTSGGVDDDTWAAVAAAYGEQERAAIVLMIATTNFFNRINVTIREPAGATWA